MVKLIAEHEDELEKAAGEVLEAKQFTQEVNKKYKIAERDYAAAKESVALTGAHAQAMEEEQ